MIKVFLGGTCNDSNWRDVIMPMLLKRGIEYFNPVVDDWNDECQAEEERQKKICSFSSLCHYTKNDRDICNS